VFKVSAYRPAVGYAYIVLFFIGAASFVYFRGDHYVAATFFLAAVGIAIRSKWAIRIVRIFFGLAAAAGILFFFNPFMLRDFAGGHDPVSVISRAVLLFAVYEIMLGTGFYFSSKILRASE
jgi:hypothetical protein